MSAETDYIAYLETKVCTQAYRIGELEAALLYVLNLKDHGHNPAKVYIKATLILNNEMTCSKEFSDKYKELLSE